MQDGKNRSKPVDLQPTKTQIIMKTMPLADLNQLNKTLNKQVVASFYVKLQRLAFAALVLATTGCSTWAPLPNLTFDLQAHRGGRGLAPENTLTAMRGAIALGVHTLETDLAITQDGVIVLAHDPHLNPNLVRDARGQWLQSKGPTIKSLTFAQLQTYDIGRLNPESSYARNYPTQIPADGERFHTLDALFQLVKSSGKPLRFNIETKLTPTGDSPSVNETVSAQTFAQTVVAAIHRAGAADRVTIQSFDWRTLIAAKKLAPQIQTACLTAVTPTLDTVTPDANGVSAWLGGVRLDSFAGSIPKAVKAAGCETWSMSWRNLTRALTIEAKALGLKVLPWTVNEPGDMLALIDMGVDGLITDYPDRLREVMRQRALPLP
jgi:glycerophosphoryl diester phosphodiesterase